MQFFIVRQNLRQTFFFEAENLRQTCSLHLDDKKPSPAKEI